MAFPLLDLNELSVSPQSPTITEPGLDDLGSDDGPFFGTNNPNVIADKNDDATIDLTELQTEARKKELTSEERLAAYQCLLERMKDGILKRGSARVVAVMFGVGIRSIQRLWRRARDSGSQGHETLRVRNYGRKRIGFDLERIKDIPLRQRTTIRSLAYALGVSRNFVSQKLREGAIRRHTNAIKPSLTQDNMTSRMKHCLEHLDPTTLPHSPTFKMMENTIHIDEK